MRRKTLGRYIPSVIESKWQKQWDKEGLYRFSLTKGKRCYYNLVELPYPSGDLHLGHWFTFANADAHARYMHMRGYNVFYPPGFDAFGLPAENAAIKRGIHPKDWTMKNIQTMTKQFHTMGTMLCWNHQVITCLPEYYKWNQWIFLKMWERGLAYRGRALSNWCPSCQTVLANEGIEDGKCWRCGSVVEQKYIEQWFLKITDYAERLLWPDEVNSNSSYPHDTNSGKDLGSSQEEFKQFEDLTAASEITSATVDWPQSVREGQNHWIGRSVGVNLKFSILNLKYEIEVFTTRPDTLYGATFLAVAPEHPIVHTLIKRVQDNGIRAQLEKYIEIARKKTERERKEQRTKTGVFTGLYGIHPLTNVQLPIWVADYVLWGYGTGAIMAVPAHDERDFEFAIRHNLPIQEVILPKRSIYRGFVRRGSCKDFGGYCQGLKKLGVSLTQQDTDFIVYEFIKDKLEAVIALAKEFVDSKSWYDFVGEKVIVVFGDKEVLKVRRYEKGEDVWKKMQQIDPSVQKYHGLWEMLFDSVYKDLVVSLGDGIIINSKEWNGWKYPQDMEKVIAWLEEKGVGKRKVQYHLRDWSVSRQRYWGTPVPMIYCVNCWETKSQVAKRKAEYGRDYVIIDEKKHAIIPVPYADLPIELPYEVDYTPKGKPPLATASDWLRVQCPRCGNQARRDAETLDTFFDSSWYYYRYVDPHYDQAPFDTLKVRELLPVDIYFGGAEHTLGHTLYARFFTKFFKDLGLVEFDEFAKKRVQHGVILGPDGYRMSKSRGNVVNPDDLVKEYGADAVRLYLAFMMPFEATAPWNPTAIAGIYRFLRRIWDLYAKIDVREVHTDNKIEKQAGVKNNEAKMRNVQDVSVLFQDGSLTKHDLYMMHKTIKKVGDDLRDIKFNTAVAALMEWLNHLSRKERVSFEEYRTFLLLIAPFAPHVAEELFQAIQDLEFKDLTKRGEKNKIGNTKFASVHAQRWPEYDEKYLMEDMVTIIVQVNGKVRDNIKVEKEKIKIRNEVELQARQSSKVQRYIKGKIIRKVIYVEGKLVNFVTL